MYLYQIKIDPGDIRNKYGKKMEYIAKIRDGSKKEIGNGYWLCKAVASDIEQEKALDLSIIHYTSFLSSSASS